MKVSLDIEGNITKFLYMEIFNLTTKGGREKIMKGIMSYWHEEII